MKRRNALAVSLFAAWAMPASAETVLVLAGHVITDAARPARGPSTITVTDGRITAIDDGLARTFAAGVRVIDLSTKTVLPGLIDAHVHLTGDPGGDFRDEAVERPNRVLSRVRRTRGSQRWQASRRCATSGRQRSRDLRCATGRPRASFRVRAYFQWVAPSRSSGGMATFRVSALK